MITPNVHIFTKEGWKRLRELSGDELVFVYSHDYKGLPEPHYHWCPIKIKKEVIVDPVDVYCYESEKFSIELFDDTWVFVSHKGKIEKKDFSRIPDKAGITFSQEERPLLEVEELANRDFILNWISFILLARARSISNFRIVVQLYCESLANDLCRALDAVEIEYDLFVNDIQHPSKNISKKFDIGIDKIQLEDVPVQIFDAVHKNILTTPFGKLSHNGLMGLASGVYRIYGKRISSESLSRISNKSIHLLKVVEYVVNLTQNKSTRFILQDNGEYLLSISSGLSKNRIRKHDMDLLTYSGYVYEIEVDGGGWVMLRHDFESYPYQWRN